MVAEMVRAAAPEGRIKFHNKVLQAGFTQVPRSVVPIRGLSHGAKLTWIALAEYAWSDAAIFPGQDALASTLDVSLRSVVGYLQELRDKGLLVTHRRGLGLTNEYTLYCPDEQPTASPRHDADPVLIRRGLRIRHAKACAPEVQPTSHQDVQPSALPIEEETDSGETDSVGRSASHEAGAVAPPAQKQEPPPAPMPAKGPRPELPQYRVFLHLCRVVEAEVADMDGKKGRACADAVKALKALTQRYANEGHAAPPEDAEADLCAMLTWKAGRMRAQRRDPAEALTVQAAYADMAAWRKAGGPGRHEQPPAAKVKTARELETERLMQLAYARDVLGEPPTPVTHSPAVRAMLAAATQRAAALPQQKTAAW